MQQVARCPFQHFTSSLQVFGSSTGKGKFKSADWLHLITTGMLHVLAPMLTGLARKALVSLVEVYQLLLNATSDRDPLATPEFDINRRGEAMRSLKLKIVRLITDVHLRKRCTHVQLRWSNTAPCYTRS